MLAFPGKQTGKSYSLPKYSFGHSTTVFENNKLDDLLYTFGKTMPGALVLHNFPKLLTQLKLPAHQGGGVRFFNCLVLVAIIYLENIKQRDLKGLNFSFASFLIFEAPFIDTLVLKDEIFKDNITFLYFRKAHSIFKIKFPKGKVQRLVEK